jgi:hypothetical protein
MKKSSTQLMAIAASVAVLATIRILFASNKGGNADKKGRRLLFGKCSKEKLQMVRDKLELHKSRLERHLQKINSRLAEFEI